MIKTIISDCDGTLTDGKYYYTSKGRLLTTFHTYDSYATQRIKELGMKLILISSGTNQEINRRRAFDIGVELLYATPGNKLDVVKGLGLNMNEVAYLGDCIDDIPLLLESAISFCPCSSLKEVKAAADTTLERSGGEGCLLEVLLEVIEYNKLIT